MSETPPHHESLARSKDLENHALDTPRSSSVDLQPVLATLGLASNGFDTGLDLRQVTNEVLDITLGSLAQCPRRERQKAAASQQRPSYVSANRQAQSTMDGIAQMPALNRDGLAALERRRLDPIISGWRGRATTISRFSLEQAYESR